MGEAWGYSVTDHTPACGLANLKVQAVSHNMLVYFRSCLGESSVSAIFPDPESTHKKLEAYRKALCKNLLQ